MSGPAFVRLYPSDWRSGCMGLTLEQEGLYTRMCMFIAETGRRVPLDDTVAARMMNTQTRNYRRVLGELLRLGKIKRHEDGYGNDRIEFERERAEKANSKHSATASEGSDRQADQGQKREDHAAPVAATADVIPLYSRSTHVITELADEIPQQNQCPSIEPIPEPNNVDVDARAIKRVVDQAKPILKSGGMTAQLMQTAEITKWLAAGCDLEADILPTIAAAVQANKVVSSWKFFSASIVDARARRLAPLPEAKPTRVGAPAWASEKAAKSANFMSAFEQYR